MTNKLYEEISIYVSAKNENGASAEAIIETLKNEYKPYEIGFEEKNGNIEFFAEVEHEITDWDEGEEASWDCPASLPYADDWFSEEDVLDFVHNAFAGWNIIDEEVTGATEDDMNDMFEDYYRELYED